MSAWLAALRRRHAERAAALTTPAVPLPALQMALALFLVAGAMFAIGGYHVGFETLNGAGTGWSDTALMLLTYSGDTVPAVLLLAPLAHRYRQIVWFAVLAALVATLLCHGLKPVLDMPRPPAVLATDTFHLVGPGYRHVSFPSGHSVTAFVTAGVLAWYTPGLAARVALLGCAVLIAWSRVAVGAHWPIDTVGGAAFGLLAVAIAARLMPRWGGGLRFWPYHVIVLLLAIGCVVALRLAPPYPLAAPLLRVLALVGLFCLLRDFVVQPLREARIAAPAEAHQPDPS